MFNGNRGAIGTGYIDFYNEDKKLLLATYDGIFAYSKIDNLKNFQKINSNINSLIKYEKFYLHEQYGIKDIFIDKETLYVAYTGNKKDDCYDLKIISSKQNENWKYLLDDLKNFKVKTSGLSGKEIKEKIFYERLKLIESYKNDL